MIRSSLHYDCTINPYINHIANTNSFMTTRNVAISIGNLIIVVMMEGWR